jgi:hydrogenase maturation protease
MTQAMKSILVLACGNTLRGDDGVAWHIGAALQQDGADPEAEIILTRQLLPEHAELLRTADLVVFIDCSAVAEPGVISTIPITPAHVLPRIFTHHLDPASLLKLAQDLYGRIPSRAMAITVGGQSFELIEQLSKPVTAAIPIAVEVVRRAYVNAAQE